jgi:hypothetical protein
MTDFMLAPGIHTIQLTPTLAAQLFNSTSTNRRISPTTVGRYVADIKDGNWRLGNDMLVVTAHGELRNGQHRCLAVMEAGTDIPVILRVQAPGEGDEFDIFDQNYVRRAGQILGIEGVTNAVAKAAAARMIYGYDHLPTRVWAGPTMTVFTRKMQTDYVLKYRDAFDTAGSYPMWRTSSRTLNIALAFLVARDSVMADEFDTFYDGLSTGARLPQDDPRLALRNLLAQPKEKRVRWGSGQSDFGIYIKTWNSYISDREVKVVRFRRDELPMPKVQ